MTAVAQDWERASSGVPAMNYSTLLDRSVDFDVFSTVFDPSYPDWVDRQLVILLAQMLWDRGENDGYAQHLTGNPYPGTPEHEVMLYEAFGDHQVANVATEVMARSIGAELRACPGRRAQPSTSSRSGGSSPPGRCLPRAVRTSWSGTSAPRRPRWERPEPGGRGPPRQGAGPGRRADGGLGVPRHRPPGGDVPRGPVPDVAVTALIRLPVRGEVTPRVF